MMNIEIRNNKQARYSAFPVQSIPGFPAEQCRRPHLRKCAAEGRGSDVDVGLSWLNVVLQSKAKQQWL